MKTNLIKVRDASRKRVLKGPKGYPNTNTLFDTLVPFLETAKPFNKTTLPQREIQFNAIAIKNIVGYTHSTAHDSLFGTGRRLRP